MINIEIEDRKSIIERAKKPFPLHTALISITDVDAGVIVLKNKPEHFLFLKFNDENFDDLEFNLGKTPTKKEQQQYAKINNMISDEQAEKIAIFIKSNINEVDTLICQCEYGQSRSAALAAAIKQFIFKNGIEIFADDRYYPNKYVYRKILSALENDSSQ
jgi:predicted protein tyrosine phosphatase